MIQEITSKWILKYKDWSLIITSDKKVIDVDTKVQLIEYWNNGVISFRFPGTSKRIGIKTINKHCIKKKITIQDFCPF